MELDRGLGNTLLREECGYLSPLVTLELDDLTHLLVVDEGAVASELLVAGLSARKHRAGYSNLLECLQELFRIDVCG
jgi:hypothetical protein